MAKRELSILTAFMKFDNLSTILFILDLITKTENEALYSISVIQLIPYINKKATGRKRRYC